MACGQVVLSINFAWQLYNAGLSGKWPECTKVKEKRGERSLMMNLLVHFGIRLIVCLQAKCDGNEDQDMEGRVLPEKRLPMRLQRQRERAVAFRLVAASSSRLGESTAFSDFALF